MKNITEILWNPRTTFQQFFYWMNPKKRVDYLINQNKTFIIDYQMRHQMNQKLFFLLLCCNYSFNVVATVLQFVHYRDYSREISVNH
jgi:hypothetical protein